MKKSHIFLLCASSFIMGVAAGLVGKFDFVFLLPFFGVLVLLLVILGRNADVRILLCAYFLFFLGILRVDLGPHMPAARDLEKYEKAKIDIMGTILDEPRLNYDSQELKVGVEKNNLSSPWLRKVLVRAPFYPRCSYGEKIEVKCKLARISSFGNIKTDKELSLENIYFICYAASVEPVDKDKGINFYKSILAFKDKLRFIIFKYVSAPENEIMGALMLGDSHALNGDLQSAFNNVEAGYILSMPGIRMAFFLIIILVFLNAIGISRKLALFIALPMLIFYIALIGFSISALRAAFMLILISLAARWGRLAKSLNLLILAAFLILLWKPGVLFYDLGFQFAFIALAGIIFLFPIIKQKLCFIKNDYLIDLMAVSLSAWISTLPLVAYYFGIFSLSSLFAGILIIWMIPALIVMGFLLFLVALAAPFLGWIINILGIGISICARYVIVIINFLNTKFLIFNIGRIYSWQIGVFYAALLIFIIFERKNASL